MTKELTSLAAGLAAGSLTHDEILYRLGGDKSLLKEVIALAGGYGVGNLASNLTRDIIEVTPLNDVCDLVDNSIKSLFDW